MKVLCSCGREYWPMQAWIHEKCRSLPVVNPVTDVANAVANARESSAGGEQVSPLGARGEVERVEAWRKANRDRYNARQKEAARRYRVKRREAARAGLQEGVK